MIIQYFNETLEIENIVMGTSAFTVAQWEATRPSTGHVVFEVADDTATLAAPDDYYVIETMGTPVGTAEKRVISMTSSIDPIDLSDTPTITIQLMESDGTTPLSEVATITVSVDRGILSSSTITTNGSGVGTFTYKPTKEAGLVTIAATSPSFVNASLAITANTPSTDADQNWLETDDIKEGAITTAKLAEDAVMNSDATKFRQTNPSNWWFADKGYVQDYWYVGLADSVNTVIGDDEKYIYVHGYAATGNVDPSIVKVDKYSGATGGIYTYTNANLQAGVDSMTYDGRYLYTSSLTDMLRVDPQDMTLDSTIASGGASQFYMNRWDADGAIYAYLYGGGDYRMSRIYPANADIEIIATSLTAVNVQRNIEITGDTVIWAMNQGLYFFNRKSEQTSVVNINSDLGINSTITGIVATNNKVFVCAEPFSGTTAVLQILWAWDATYTAVTASVEASIDDAQTGTPHAITYDGIYMWVATEEPLPNAGTGNACLLQKMRQSSSDPSALEILQTINLGEDWSINALYFDNNRLYATNLNAVE